MNGTRWLSTLLVVFGCAHAARAQDAKVRVGVLGMFHPRLLTLQSARDRDLGVSFKEQQWFVRPRSSCSTLELRASGDELLLRCGKEQVRAPELRAAGRNQENTEFVLGIPGQFGRRYAGSLRATAKNGEILAVVEMDLETAVASIVRAESLPDTPLEALQAQAVVSRSYLAAGRGRHQDFDFCDLTHCQLLREPPAASSPAAKAAEATRGMVLAYHDAPIAAMFTRSCAGTTRVPGGGDLPSAGYPYYAVRCEICRKNPIRWQRTLAQADARTLATQGETGRIAIGRKLGWDAVPSYSFTAREQGEQAVLEGVGQGHGIGLCQRGARGFAVLGSDFRSILSHYFPNTTLIRR